MRVLIGLTYYRPHYSGLTIYTERLARTLAARGHQVTVLTSRFNPDLPTTEVKDGVRIWRPAVLTRLSKGVIMPSMPFHARRLIQSADVVNLHVPQMDAAYIAPMARWMGKPVVMTYHCELMLPPGLVHRLANMGSQLADSLTAAAANVIVTNTQEYAENSNFLHHHLKKVRIIPPPVELVEVTAEQIQAFRERFDLKPGQPLIGMAARLATEKGVETLIEAMPTVLKKYPGARVLFLGQYQNVLGEEAYARRLQPTIESLGEHWSFLGNVSPVDLAAFFHVCDLTVLPSLNATESFGMVQVESMFCGTPVIASDLPGVRHAVRTTGMGRIVTPRDSAGLAEAILDLLAHPEVYQGKTEDVRSLFSSEKVAAQYETLFEELVQHKL